MTRNGDSVATYMRNLDAGDFEAAAAMFTEDAIYSRSASDAKGNPSGRLDVIVGRANILAYFQTRGVRSYRHDICYVAVHGHMEFVAGVVEGGPDSAMLASATVDEQGLITRYVGLASPAEEAVRTTIKAYATGSASTRPTVAES
jgi:hypothetical protein